MSHPKFFQIICSLDELCRLAPYGKTWKVEVEHS
ncbi:hypothetical protein RDI58_027200 [Solanum bulbocastanum]|uniref:Uncharacterized protein n=1 Tax=Solanum bulbocastanum TaxID=147425 RepID=A0AAN8Y1W7_SOLBU